MFSKTLLCLTAILTNSNHQHNGMEGTKKIVYNSQLNIKVSVI